MLTDNSYGVFLLCSGLSRDNAAPLSAKEFHAFRQNLIRYGTSFGELMKMRADDIPDDVLSDKVTRFRLSGLLNRAGILGLELDKILKNGIWIKTIEDLDYPVKLKNYLAESAPPVLYGVGNLDIVSANAVAVVGSRDVDEEGIEFAAAAACLAAKSGVAVISGGAKGVDSAAMETALDYGGMVCGVLTANLSGTAVSRRYREHLLNGNLTLLTTFNPDAGFNVGNAMARNKYIYAFSEWAVVVSSSYNTGGTWAGAVENLKAFRPVPMFVRHGDNVPEGNGSLIEKGGIPLTMENLREATKWDEVVKEHRSREKVDFSQKMLFDVS